MKKQTEANNNWISGVALLLIGGWFLLMNLGGAPSWQEQLWPTYPLLGGMALIAHYFGNGRREAGVLIPGTAGLLLGAFFFFFTLGLVEWGALGWLWPIFPLIGGFAFLVAWYAGRQHALLIPAIGAMAVGLIGLLFAPSWGSVAWIGRIWPVMLIAVGLILLFSKK